ncbi:unnamed protein product [Heligmosomoides polygyrus]|uniref:DDE_Tnp_1_7 domain-containing protein n=1 Tax=Heligmosomoides polygyrus TaxID=6339 RepID=A0A183FYE9_HELPZ|nr:unnamed protein product [Heligmosomoides polygyrus]
MTSCRTVLRDRKIRLLVESDDEDDEVVQEDVDAEDDILVLPTDDVDGSESEVIESDAEDEDKEAWKSDLEASNRWNFAKESGFHDEVFDCGRPIDYYRLFFNDELLVEATKLAT